MTSLLASIDALRCKATSLSMQSSDRCGDVTQSTTSTTPPLTPLKSGSGSGAMFSPTANSASVSIKRAQQTQTYRSPSAMAASNAASTPSSSSAGTSFSFSSKKLTPSYSPLPSSVNKGVPPSTSRKSANVDVSDKGNEMAIQFVPELAFIVIDEVSKYIISVCCFFRCIHKIYVLFPQIDALGKSGQHSEKQVRKFFTFVKLKR